jgi:hypothetical protein
MAEQTESSIVVDASPKTVMEVIADLEAYPAWSDGITAVEVLAMGPDGRPAQARFHLASGPIKDTYDLDFTWLGDSSVRWILTKGDMLTMMDGSYTLTQNGPESTTVEYRLVVDVKIPMIGMLKRKAEKVIVDTALKGLRKRVDSLA